MIYKPKVWVDLDNTPHVPFFEPIIEELRRCGFPLLITARDAFQVCALADKKGIHYTRVGRHYGKSRLRKVTGLVFRSLQLSRIVLREKPALGVSHGARSQILLCNALRIPTLMLMDYEFARFPFGLRPTWIMVPEAIPGESLLLNNGHVLRFSGLKEDVYAWKLRPDLKELDGLNLAKATVVATVRPAATEAHYHNVNSEILFEAFMRRACSTPGMKVILLPRNQQQARALESRWPQWFKEGKVVIPPAAMDGLNLIWHSDLVVSGGGTMNREAAVLGVPVYSIFRGKIGAVDQYLEKTGRLVLVESAREVEEKIHFVRRQRKAVSEVTSRKVLEQVVAAIERLAQGMVRN